MISRAVWTMRDLRAASSEYKMPILLLVCTEPAWSHLIDEVIATGVNVNAPLRESTTPLGFAIYNGILNVARALVAAGAKPTPLGQMGRNVIHNAVFYDNSGDTDIMDVVRYAVELYPNGVNDLDFGGRSPLQLAVDMRAQRDVVSLLLSRGCSTRTLASTVQSEYASGMWHLVPLLVAYGYRFSLTDAEPYYRTRDVDLIPIITGTEQCRSVARVILGLGRVKGRLLGNGRDALRLVAREVWLSRMDEGWLAK